MRCEVWDVCREEHNVINIIAKPNYELCIMNYELPLREPNYEL